MILSPDTVIPYLLDRGLITPRDIVQNRIQLRDLSRRNRNYALTFPDGSGYLLKQGVAQTGAHKLFHTVSYEGEVYSLLHSADCPINIRSHLVPFHGFDEKTGILCIELMPSFDQVRKQYFQNAQFPVEHSRQFAKTLAETHRLSPQDADKLHIKIAKSPAPSIFGYGCPDLDSFYKLSAASQQLLGIIQETESFTEHLNAMRADWREDSFIHSDVKFENWAISNPETQEIKLIDWETSGWGDRRWDLGSVIGDYLVFWVISMPLSGATPAEKAVQNTRFPLEVMQPAIREFWHTYSAATGWDEQKSAEQLISVMRFAALRLLQAAIELMQTANEMSGAAVTLFQVSYNIMQNPENATQTLLDMVDAELQ
ncbi:hypothetical protein GCM10007094_44480 [Pseudovibrio japonicus]|uniref:Aminoglycoside phosphotransferase domain-containing protein n=1 Tax=Pseudovibrio japonicus TaxID=366534 RepID=A0ABQ3ES65_9HYPH|nr:phosphotransferase [Pseudovibrio japonicus]GHB50312.1 hypothetical protein GCM10007094_44480 [Pseudovibrio japonicus]